MTYCTQPVPRWNFSCTRANIKKNDYIDMWNPVLSIKKIPVFYLPYLRYPLNKERSTGFLMPQIGFSGAKGFSYTQSYYWIVKRNMDATFTLDFFSARGLGSGLEYRYLLSGGVGGQLNLYYFNYMKGSETPCLSSSIL
jgi:lipopolysaccharide assembly outer membrane protein LptD (OstA)